MKLMALLDYLKRNQFYKIETSDNPLLTAHVWIEAVKRVGNTIFDVLVKGDVYSLTIIDYPINEKPKIPHLLSVTVNNIDDFVSIIKSNLKGKYNG